MYPSTAMPTAYFPYTSQMYGVGGARQTQTAPGVLVNSPELAQSIQLLRGIRHRPQDELYLKRMGINLIFVSGEHAYQTLLRKGVRVVYGDMGNSKAHAQWKRESNTIIINQNYQGRPSLETLYALSEAIYHEAGHAARLGDGRSSLQEEINNLALNTLAYRYHVASNPAYAATASQSPLIQDGVALYAKLFFDPDPNKTALVNRIIEKYGMLPAQSPDHRIPRPAPFSPNNPTRHGLPLVHLVLQKLHENSVAQQVNWGQYLQALQQRSATSPRPTA